MSEQRDFKGVWIPKEIWLNKKLSMVEKGILTEIASLDNSEHCYASNEYFAEFCQVSVATVTRSIKKLMDLGYIESVAFNGRSRLIKLTSLPNQIDEAASSKCATINIYNNTNKKSISNDIDTTFEFGKVKEAKQSLYSKCTAHIYAFSKSLSVQKYLKDFLDMLIEMKRLRGEKQFIGILNKLKSYSESAEDQIKIIQYSIEHGYPTFYELKSDYRRTCSSDVGQHSVSMTKEQKELARRAIENGTAEKF